MPEPMRLYFRNFGSVYSPATIRGVWDNTGGTKVDAHLGREPGGTSGPLVQSATGAYTDYDIMRLQYVSEPFLRAGTIAGLATWVVGVDEDDPDGVATHYIQIHAYVEVDESDTVRGTLIPNRRDATAWPATPTGLDDSYDVLAVSCAVGDRLILEFGYSLNRSSSTAAQSTANMYVGGTTAPDLIVGATDMTRPGWIEFTADPLFNITQALEAALVVETTIVSDVLLVAPLSVALTTESTLTADGVTERPAEVVLVAESMLTAAGDPKKVVLADLVVETSIIAEPGPFADLVVETFVDATTTQRAVTTADLVAAAILEAAAARMRYGDATLSAESFLDVSAVREVPAAVELDVETLFDVASLRTMYPLVDVITDSSIQAVAVVTQFVPVDVWHDRYHVAGKDVLGPESRDLPGPYDLDRYHVVPLEHEEA